MKCQEVSTKQRSVGSQSGEVDSSDLIIFYISRSLSASTDDDKQADCDWGSDFEESASTPPPQRNLHFKKVKPVMTLSYVPCHVILSLQISANQIPQPYKAPQSLLQPEAGPDYSNVQVIPADVRQTLSPSPSRTNKLTQSGQSAGLTSLSSDNSTSSINYSVLKKNSHQPILLPKPAYSPLQYSTIDHSKTIKSRKQNNENKSLNGRREPGPKITSPKPSLSPAKFPGKKPCSSPLMTKHSQNFRNENEDKASKIWFCFMHAFVFVLVL